MCSSSIYIQVNVVLVLWSQRFFRIHFSANLTILTSLAPDHLNKDLGFNSWPPNLSKCLWGWMVGGGCSALDQNQRFRLELDLS